MTDSKLNIAMFGHKHVMSREGGVEIVVYELATRMAARGHQIVCYDRKSSHISGGKLDKHWEYKGVKIIPVFTVERKGLAAVTSSFFAAWKTAWSNAQVVHIHAEGPAVMCGLLKLRGKKVVVTVHGLDWARAKWGGFAARYIKFGEKQAVKRADEIIVLSRNMQEYFKYTYNRDTVFIPNGVTRPKIRAAGEIKKLWKLEKDSYVLFLGRIVPEKGLRYLIEAWKGICTEKKLVIAGGSSDTEKFLNEIKAVAGKNVIFTGFQQGRILEELYSNAYIYTLPSDLEGMPLTLLEAMSYGNCCVVSDIPECAEIVEDRAAIFQKGNVEGLKKILQELLDDEKKVQKYKDGAADYIIKKYNWENIVDLTLELYGKGFIKNRQER